jgi:nitrite reductase/ring-hydroxylating ferredoxin subunit
MGLFKRVIGISRTKRPEDPKCWKYSRGRIVIQWGRAPELRAPCGSIRLEGRGLPEKVLVMYGMDGQFHAFQNKCPHCGRRLDPVTGSTTVGCCGLFPLEFDYAGNETPEQGKDFLKTYNVETNKCTVIVHL